MAALRLLFAGKDEKKTLALRRYILALALTAFTRNPSGYLRQGCLLVLDPDRPPEFLEVYPTAERKPATITHEAALSYAASAATAFGVGESRTVEFDKERARRDVEGGAEKVKGEVILVDAGEKKFKLNISKTNEPKEIDVATNDSTDYLKGRVKSAFDQVVAKGAKVDVELANGVAVKVTGKK